MQEVHWAELLETHLWRERSRTRQRRKWNGDAVTMVSTDSRELLRVVPNRDKGRGPLYPSTEQLLMWLPQKEDNVGWGRSLHPGPVPGKEFSRQPSSANTSNSWEMRASVKKGISGWYTPPLNTKILKGEVNPFTPQNLGKAQGQECLRARGGLMLKTEASSESVYEKVPISPEPWGKTEDSQCGELQPQRFQSRDSKHGRGVLGGEDNFLKMGSSTFWVVRPPTPAGRSLDREFISKETGQPKRKDLPQWDLTILKSKKQASHLVTLIKITEQ